MKPPDEKYALIPTRKTMGAINIPGIYCKGCGDTFALYSYSVFQADGYDENDKPFYEKCLTCQKATVAGSAPDSKTPPASASSKTP